MWKWWSEFTCRHYVWIATDTLSAGDDQSLMLSFSEMVCLNCSKVRHDSILRSHEKVIVGWNEE